MKRLAASIAILLLAFIGCNLANGQSSKTCTGKDCCNKDKGKKRTVASNVKPLACKLTSNELRDRKTTVIAELKGLILERKELHNGYFYKFKGDDENIDRLTSFVKTERACCDFFDFKLNIKGAFVYLELTGPKGAKEFVDTEIGM